MFKLILVTPGGGARLPGSRIATSPPGVGSGGCEDWVQWGKSRSALWVEQRGGQVHNLLHLEETGWFFRTVLPATPHTLLGMGRPCSTASVAHPTGGTFRSIVDWCPHSAEKRPHGRAQRCGPFPAGPGGQNLRSDLQIKEQLPAGPHRASPPPSQLRWTDSPRVTEHSDPPVAAPCGLGPEGLALPGWCPQHYLMLTDPRPGVTHNSTGSSPGAPSSILHKSPHLHISLSSCVDSSNGTYPLLMEIKCLNLQKLLGATKGFRKVLGGLCIGITTPCWMEWLCPNIGDPAIQTEIWGHTSQASLSPGVLSMTQVQQDTGAAASRTRLLGQVFWESWHQTSSTTPFAAPFSAFPTKRRLCPRLLRGDPWLCRASLCLERGNMRAHPPLLSSSLTASCPGPCKRSYCQMDKMGRDSFRRPRKCEEAAGSVHLW